MIMITCLIISSIAALILRAVYRSLTENNPTTEEKKIKTPEEIPRRMYRNAYYMYASIEAEGLEQRKDLRDVE